MPAASRHVANARATRLLRSSNAAAQPTQYRTSSSSRRAVGGERGDRRDLERQALRPVGPGRGGLAPRVALALHARNAPVSSAGKRDSSRTRFRRSPTILSTCSISTGHASTQAPHVTQSQTASYGIASSTIGCAIRVGCRRRVVEAVRLADDRAVRDQVEAVLRLDRHVPETHDEGLGVERLARIPRRTRLLAAAALGAGEAVEQVLPAEVLERLQAERRVLALEVHDRQLAARA